MRKTKAKNLNDVLAALPHKRRAKVEQRTGELATLKDLAWPLNTPSKTSPRALGWSP